MDDSNKSIKNDPQNAATFDTRAFARIKQKQYEEAIDDCNTALKLGRKLPAAWFHMGKAYEGLGDSASAARYLEKAKELGYKPDPAEQ